MRRFERQLRKIAKRETEPFERWSEIHQDELISAGVRFSKKEEKKSTKKFRWLYSGVAFAGVVILCLVISLSAFLPRDPLDQYYGEGDVYTDSVTDEEIKSLFDILPIMQNCDYLTSKGIRLKKNNQLVFLNVYGELLAETNYYIITVNQLVDSKYNFIEKEKYLNLTEFYENNLVCVKYLYIGISIDGFNRYLLYLEKNENIFYLEINCLDDNLDELFVLLSE